jgi:LmbE family N-acetylglucosaminyl deacetylase
MAHPDDEILGCGGLLAKHSNSMSFRVLFLAEGSSCRYEISEIELYKSAIAEREKSAKEALSIFAPESIHFMNLPCGRLDQFPILELNKIIECHINNFKPTTILTHSESDTNSDHRKVVESTLMATRPGALNIVPNVLSVEIPSSSEWNFSQPFQPNYFLKLDNNHLETKIESLLKYKSEIREYPFPRSREGITAFARYRGIQSGNDFAEAYRIIRFIENQ